MEEIKKLEIDTNNKPDSTPDTVECKKEEKEETVEERRKKVRNRIMTPQNDKPERQKKLLRIRRIKKKKKYRATFILV